MGNVLRILAIIAIIAGFLLKKDGWPEGDSIMKCGIAAIVVIFVLSLIRISKHSRGKH